MEAEEERDSVDSRSGLVAKGGVSNQGGLDGEKGTTSDWAPETQSWRADTDVEIGTPF